MLRAAFRGYFSFQASARLRATVTKNDADDDFFDTAFAAAAPKRGLLVVGACLFKNSPIAKLLASQIDDVHDIYIPLWNDEFNSGLAMLKPHSLAKITISDGKTPAQRDAHLRHGRYPKGTVLPETTKPACPRVRVADLPTGHLKQKHIDHLEQNQQIASCCRHPENHDVEALKSHPDEQAPDIYIFHCKCGKKHRFFCVGMYDERPVWEAS